MKAELRRSSAAFTLNWRDVLEYESKPTPRIPPEYMATVQAFGVTFERMVHAIWTEEHRRRRLFRNSQAAALLDISTCLLENGLLDKHPLLVEHLVNCGAINIRKLQLEILKREQPRRASGFWQKPVDRDLLLLHDQKAMIVDKSALRKDRLLPQLKDMREISEQFYVSYDYRNKRGQTAASFATDREKNSFKSAALRSIDRRLDDLLRERNRVWEIDWQFADLLGDNLGHLRPQVDLGGIEFSGSG